MKWRKFYRAKGFGGTQSILDTVSEFNKLQHCKLQITFSQFSTKKNLFIKKYRRKSISVF